MSIYFLTQIDLSELLNYIKENYDCYSPKLKQDKYFINKSNSDIDINSLFGNRTEEPVSTLFFPPRENTNQKTENKTKKALIGLKACDLNALRILDYVFTEEGNVEESYLETRNNTLLISTDCISYENHCFCTLLGNHPYPEDLFDLNISKVRNNYILEVRSEKGKELIKNFSFQKANETNIEEQKFCRNEIENNQIRQLKEKGFTFNYLSLDYIIKNSINSEVWEKESKRCVECGACTFVCPTCHCFLISAGADDPASKIKNWDSCLLYGFSRVAGGSNPRKYLKNRLRNRFYKKFVFFMELIDKLGCTGCGRCINTCLGNIDIRNVLEEISSEKSVSI
jgi:sulfhydrogenase subunit beta (sulfur reductase)